MRLIKQIIRKELAKRDLLVVKHKDIEAFSKLIKKRDKEILDLREQLVFIPVSGDLAQADHFCEDAMGTYHKHDFLTDPAYISAYKRGIKAVGKDLHFHWRVHVALWVASHCITLPGDFVECGVHKGFLASAIMDYLHWNTRNKKFYLYDTFNGIDEKLLTKDEIKKGKAEQWRDTYKDDVYDIVKKNFKEYNGVVLVRGSIPSSLNNVDIKQVSYLSIDMNNATPEIAAAEYFWPKLVKGAIILLDDYAYLGFDSQKIAFDKFAKRHHIKILSLPTGQGMIIKP